MFQNGLYSGIQPCYRTTFLLFAGYEDIFQRIDDLVASRHRDAVDLVGDPFNVQATIFSHRLLLLSYKTQ